MVYWVALAPPPDPVVILAMAKLTEKQEKFAQLVGAKGLGQSEAYRQVYSVTNMSDQAVYSEAFDVANRPHVALRISELRKIRDDAAVKSITFDIKRLMETYVAIAMTDPNELISVKVGCCRYCHGVDHEYQWREREYLDEVARWEIEPVNPKNNEPRLMPDPAGGFGFKHGNPPHPECPRCDGDGVSRVVPMDTTKLSPGARQLYRGAQQTKDGIKILFADKDKTLDQIGRMLGAFDDKLRVDLEGRVASLKLTTSDPKEAADAYARMIGS